MYRDRHLCSGKLKHMFFGYDWKMRKEVTIYFFKSSAKKCTLPFINLEDINPGYDGSNIQYLQKYE
jgi:hypothetical protein